MVPSMSQDAVAFLSHYWRDLGSPLALKLRSLMLSGEYDKMCDLFELDYSGFRDPTRLCKARAAVDIIRKADYLPIGVDRCHSALQKWAEAEALCRKTNLQIMYVEMNHSKADTILLEWLPRIRRTLKRVLGPIPDLDDVFGGFGPGATLSNNRARNSVLHKLKTETPTLTKQAVWYLPALPRRLKNLWFREQNLNIVKAGRLSLVPKNYKTERPIMVEPIVNASIQKYFGDHLAKRLQYLGLDKTTAPARHCELACEGSLTGKWATIDLSSASDTISKGLVQYLLPRDWFRVLDNCRTHAIDLTEFYSKYEEIFKKYGIRKSTHTLEKFSSMGNGFTFELETLIFFAICKTVCPKGSAVYVYGDDIIVNREHVNQVITVLQACGFVLNLEKSFTGLPYFRESCGGDFLFGVPVKGETLKTLPQSPLDWIDLHNRLWILSRERNLYLENTLTWIIKKVPRKYRTFIPPRLGTGGFFSETARAKIVNGIHYYKCTVPQASYQKNWEMRFNPDVILAALLLGGVPCRDAGITDANVNKVRLNGELLGPALHYEVPHFRQTWVACS